MNFTSAEISAWIGQYLWPLFRIGAALGAAPVFGTRLVPARIRLGLALVLTLVIAPALPAVPTVDPLSTAGVMTTFHQLLIGLAMGFTLQLTFSAFTHGGQIVAMQMGLGFASMVDPQNGVQVPVVSQFYIVLATLTFLALNGHLALIEVLAESFRTIPIAPVGIALSSVWDLIGWAGTMFAGAMRIALPAVAALLVANLAFGVMTRAAPQINIFAVGFPLTLILGLLAMWFTVPGLGRHVEWLVSGAFDLMRRFAPGGG